VSLLDDLPSVLVGLRKLVVALGRVPSDGAPIDTDEADSEDDENEDGDDEDASSEISDAPPRDSCRTGSSS